MNYSSVPIPQANENFCFSKDEPTVRVRVAQGEPLVSKIRALLAWFIEFGKKHHSLNPNVHNFLHRFRLEFWQHSKAEFEVCLEVDAGAWYDFVRPDQQEVERWKQRASQEHESYKRELEKYQRTLTGPMTGDGYACPFISTACCTIHQCPYFHKEEDPQCEHLDCRSMQTLACACLNWHPVKKCCSTVEHIEGPQQPCFGSPSFEIRLSNLDPNYVLCARYAGYRELLLCPNWDCHLTNCDLIFTDQFWHVCFGVASVLEKKFDEIRAIEKFAFNFGHRETVISKGKAKHCHGHLHLILSSNFVKQCAIAKVSEFQHLWYRLMPPMNYRDFDIRNLEKAMT